ncbi:hypothetical protein [Acetobacter okinawensis]|uniref:hypothetical protein n=1 Tax=Acetobacter okinawensis TaxID=1076594 RepID=UPI00046F8508|nr:hypothetical protein [Acetobacter okinawensis]
MVSCDVPMGGGQIKLDLAPQKTAEVAHHSATPAAAIVQTVDALSPEMGIFSEAVVEEGLHVSQNTILGFVDVGPLRLALEAPIAGTMLLCLVPVNSVVGYHQPFSVSSQTNARSALLALQCPIKGFYPSGMFYHPARA